MLKKIKDIFAFRNLLLAFIIRGFKAKYKNSYLGIFWSLLNPLLNVLVLAFIFTYIIKIDIRHYPLYLLSTIFAWNFFHSCLTNSVVSIIEDTHFVKNVSFPIEIIPLSVALVNLLNLIIDLGIVLVFLAFLGKWPNINWAYLPILIGIEFILSCGLSILGAGAYVIFRDLNFILNFSLKLFFYLVPVIYPLEFVPQRILNWYLINPLAVVIDGFAKVLFYGAPVDFKWLSLALAESIVIFITCLYIFQRIRKFIPERL